MMEDNLIMIYKTLPKSNCKDILTNYKAGVNNLMQTRHKFVVFLV